MQDGAKDCNKSLDTFKLENQCKNVKVLIPRQLNHSNLEIHKHQIYQNIIRNASIPLIFSSDINQNELYAGQNLKRVHNQSFYTEEEISNGKKLYQKLKSDGKIGENVEATDVIAFRAQQQLHGNTHESEEYEKNKYMKSEMNNDKLIYKFATCHIIPHSKNGTYDPSNVRIGDYELNGIISDRVDPVIVKTSDGKLDFSKCTYDCFENMNTENDIPFFRLGDYIFSSNKIPDTNSHGVLIKDLSEKAQALINNAPKKQLDEWKLKHLKINPATADIYRAINTLANLR